MSKTKKTLLVLLAVFFVTPILCLGTGYGAIQFGSLMKYSESNNGMEIEYLQNKEVLLNKRITDYENGSNNKYANMLQEYSSPSYLNYYVEKINKPAKNLETIDTKKDIYSVNKLCHYTIKYPQINDQSNPKYRKVNQEIENFFSSETKYLDLCEQEVKEYQEGLDFTVVYVKTINYKLGLANENILSVLYDSSSVYADMKTGIMRQAYPNLEFKAFNYDLESVRKIENTDILNYWEFDALRIEVREKLKDKGILYLNEEDYIIFPYRNYFWYLEKDNLVIINIFDAHFGRGLQVRIAYSNLDSLNLHF